MAIFAWLYVPLVLAEFAFDQGRKGGHRFGGLSCLVLGHDRVDAPLEHRQRTADVRRVKHGGALAVNGRRFR